PLASGCSPTIPSGRKLASRSMAKSWIRIGRRSIGTIFQSSRNRSLPRDRPAWGWGWWLVPVPIGGLIGHVEPGRVDPAVALFFRDEVGVEYARHQQRAFDGPGGFARFNHLLDALHHMGEVHEGAGFLGPEESRVDFSRVGVAPRGGEVDQVRGPQQAG